MFTFTTLDFFKGLEKYFPFLWRMMIQTLQNYIDEFFISALPNDVRPEPLPPRRRHGQREDRLSSRSGSGPSFESEDVHVADDVDDQQDDVGAADYQHRVHR